ncbi:hypothetical protein WMY93_002739 [Mugilogobius chulae]|uniref:Uncharacterized protein n=1 Tax=Mugilogobius chulae TaxID=88201 RepID=A0AAW0PUU1_9GOBI
MLHDISVVHRPAGPVLSGSDRSSHHNTDQCSQALTSAHRLWTSCSQTTDQCSRHCQCSQAMTGSSQLTSAHRHWTSAQRFFDQSITYRTLPVVKTLTSGHRQDTDQCIAHDFNSLPPPDEALVSAVSTWQLSVSHWSRALYHVMCL